MTSYQVAGDDVSGRWPTRFGWFAYGVPILSVAAAIIITALMAHWFIPKPVGFLMLSAVIATAWLAGFGPALLATALALLAFQYNIAPPANLFVWKQNFFAVDPAEAPRLALFVVVSLIVSSAIAAQRKATDALRRSRDELQTAIEGLKRTESALLKTETI